MFETRFTMIFLMLMLWLLRHSLNSERAWNRFVFECSKAECVYGEREKKFKNAHRIQPFDERDGMHHMPMAMRWNWTGWHDVWFTQTHLRTHTNTDTHTFAPETQKHTTDCARWYMYSNAHYHHITTTCACDYMLPLADAYAVACSFFCYFRWSGEQTLSVRALRICVRWMPVRACVSMCALIKAFGTGFMRLHAFVAVCCFLLN